MLDKPKSETGKKDAVVIKKYANRRLYNTETSSYVTLDDLAQMVRSDREFVVYDAKTGDDLTHSVLTQIIVEQESRSGGQALLPIPFLRQLIRFYDDGLARLVPGYLQFSLETLTREQERFRTEFANTWGPAALGPAAFEAYKEQARRNLALFEQAMKMWSPFTGAIGAPRPAGEVAPKTEEKAEGTKPPAATPAERDIARDDLEQMKAQLAEMQSKLEQLSRSRS
jgi:polyhydroxyalkanoate synthesis repressor PhaR